MGLGLTRHRASSSSAGSRPRPAAALLLRPSGDTCGRTQREGPWAWGLARAPPATRHPPPEEVPGRLSTAPSLRGPLEPPPVS